MFIFRYRHSEWDHSAQVADMHVITEVFEGREYSVGTWENFLPKPEPGEPSWLPNRTAIRIDGGEGWNQRTIVLGGDAEIYVMNSNGKTIDTIR